MPRPRPERDAQRKSRPLRLTDEQWASLQQASTQRGEPINALLEAAIAAYLAVPRPATVPRPHVRGRAAPAVPPASSPASGVVPSWRGPYTKERQAWPGGTRRTGSPKTPVVGDGDGDGDSHDPPLPD